MVNHPKHEKPELITSELPATPPPPAAGSVYSAPSSMDILKTIPVKNPPDKKLWIMGIVDRTLRTILQAVVGYGTVSGISLDGGFNYIGMLSVALGAAILSVGTSLISAPSFGNSWLYQICERSVKTFIQTFIGGMVSITIGGATFTVLPQDFTAVLQASGVAALVSILTSIVSTNIGTTGSVDIVVPSNSAT